MVHILNPGMLSTVQDLGRFGYMSTGFSPGGAMDSFALQLANILVGNAPGDGAVEMTAMGMTVRFDSSCAIALTGADMQPKINGESVSMNKTLEVNAGDVLSCGYAAKGMRTYLAVSGGFELPLVMGSMSTNLKCGLGGFTGRALKKGDALPLRYQLTTDMIGCHSFTPENYMDTPLTLRVVLGPQEDMFTDEGIRTFLSRVYRVSEQSDRMGLRLEGPKIENKNGVDIISDGIATGAVQIPSSGTPIIMMADRQTTGGYAKIATVISADLKRIAQAKPGTALRFRAVTMQEALRLKKEEQTSLTRLQYRICISK